MISDDLVPNPDRRAFSGTTWGFLQLEVTVLQLKILHWWRWLGFIDSLEPAERLPRISSMSCHPI